MGGTVLDTCMPEGWIRHIRAARTEQLDKCISQAAAVYFHTSLAICLTVYWPNNCHFEGVTKCWGKCRKIKQQWSKLHNQEFYKLFIADNIVRVNQLTRTLWPEKVSQYLSQRLHQVPLWSVMLKSINTRASEDLTLHATYHHRKELVVTVWKVTCATTGVCAQGLRTALHFQHVSISCTTLHFGRVNFLTC